jgi:F0F1-type ATP synthase assembly protein I
MAKQNRPFSFARATRSLQENVERSGPAAAASYTLIGAILLLGGLGYAFDAWRGTAPWGLFVGLTLGIVVGFYELMVTIFWRK